MAIALIANPSAGGKKGSRIIPRVEALLRRHRIDFRIFITQYHAHAIDIARKLTPARYNGVVSLGGDGTNFHVLNGLMKYHDPGSLPPLGIIPVGSGNSFARYTGGKMLMAPDAAIDDGWFDVVVVGPMSRRSLTATFPKIFKGSHGQHPAVQFYRARAAWVETDPPKTLLPDGELFGSTPTQVAVHPRRVRYFV